MKHDQAYKNLLEHLQTSIALSQVSGLVSWDQETMMPTEGIEARAEQSAALASIIHARNCNPHLAEWCAAIDEAALDIVGRANLREAKRSHANALRVSEKLTAEIARSAAIGQGIWADARANENVAEFLPTLTQMVSLKRQEAACLAGANDALYDALLDQYEPGMNSTALAGLLEKLRPGLTSLREKIAGSKKDIKPLSGTFSDEAQMEMAHRLADVFNYRLESGRIDKAVHPFSSGYRSDSRITTRVNPDNVFDCMYSTIHEVGHANYEQGRDPAMDRTPAGGYASMGMHESQSRMLENQIGRSRPFMDWLYPQMLDVFGDIGLASPDELFAVVNQVEPGFIRTEADEIHYNLHVMMRFDLERALISDDLQADQLEAAWNDRFKADFGHKVDKPSNGVLQDVHWSCGLFGYFPTYSLGNIYAGELFAAMSNDIQDRDDKISRGELDDLSNWLQSNIHKQGNLYSAPELMETVIGKKPDEQALVTYLEHKFSGLYGL